MCFASYVYLFDVRFIKFLLSPVSLNALPFFLRFPAGPGFPQERLDGIVTGSHVQNVY